MSFISDLRMLAKKLGCLEDAEAFLASLAADDAAQAQVKAV